MFWLIGSVPNFICTWRESMLRRCKFELFAKKGTSIEDVVSGTVLFCSAKPFHSDSVTMQDILEQKTRVGGKNHDRKCTLSVDQSEKIPQLIGLKRTACDFRLLKSNQIVNADSGPLLHVMGAGKLANIPVLPKQVSVSQINMALPALDQTVQPIPHNGSAKFVEAMMDVDCAVFAMSALTPTMNRALTVASIIEQLQSIIPPSEQASLTMLIPSGAWQRSQSTGPTVRPINGGHWWQLPSPKYTREPLKVWVHATDFLDIKILKSASMEIANALFDQFDSNNPERAQKLIVSNTQDEVKVPGGFLFPLALSVMASRIAGASDVSIILETFSNKAHGMKLNALDSLFGSFGDDNWAKKVTAKVSDLWKNSILQMVSNMTDSKCFRLIPRHTSLGFGFSTSYCDTNKKPLFSVCKQPEWIASDSYESYCTMALPASMCAHTTHFKLGPALRVQAYIEEMNCITDRQCGSSTSHYAHIGFSALDKVASGQINVSAILEGFNDDFSRVNSAMEAMGKQPRNRTEIQVYCVADKNGSLDLLAMILAASQLLVGSTQHWQLVNVLSYTSVNAAAMFFIAPQSWLLACDVNITLKNRQRVLDIGNEILTRWRSFKTGTGDGSIGPKNKKKLIAFPSLCEPLLCHLDRMLPKGEQFHRGQESISIFTDDNIMTVNFFGALMNERIERNKQQQSSILSRYIMKCCTCGELFFGTNNKDLLEVHFQDSSSCIDPDWSKKQDITASEWELDYQRRLDQYFEFLKTCSKEQKEVCESVLKFGSGILAVGIAGAGKSVALNIIGSIVECVFYEPGEFIRCGATGLLAQYFHSCATTVHSAIGARPDSFGNASTNWNLSVSEWRDLITRHGKVTSNLKVFMNTEVYAQGSNMLQAFFEIRQNSDLKFVAILDGDPPQPMHEDDSVSDIAANVQLCTISQHFLLNRSEIRRLLPDVRVVQFETPMRQRDPKVHSLSNAVRHAKAEKCHIQQMRDNPYDQKKQKVDIILCALRKDAAKINSNELKNILSPEYRYFQKSAFANIRKLNTLVLKVGAPVVFTKNHTWITADVKRSERNVVNGTRGHVEKCDADGIVVCLLNTKVKVRVEAVETKDDVNVRQLPVQLGWATTIKKAAGMTFDNVAINFGLDWSKGEANLIQCAMRPWRTSQAYGAITRSRNLAFFCDAHLFTDAVMIALLNNQNHSALEFLKSFSQSQDHYVQHKRDLRDLSTVDTSPNLGKKKRIQAHTLLSVTTGECSDPVIDHVYAKQWPQTLARQAAGFYCTGVLTSNGADVILKTSTQLQHQLHEMLALKVLSGIEGVPKLIGQAGAQLVISSSEKKPKPHCGLLTSGHIEDFRRIIGEMHAKGWTFKYITPQNVWSFGNNVMLFNFENAVLISESDSHLFTIDDFTEALKHSFGYCLSNHDDGSFIPDSITSSPNGMIEALVPSRNISNTLQISVAEDASKQMPIQNARPSALPTFQASITQPHIAEPPITSLNIMPFEQAKSSVLPISFPSEFNANSVCIPLADSQQLKLKQHKMQFLSTAGAFTNAIPASGTAQERSLSENVSVVVQRELDFKQFTNDRYSKCLEKWLRKSDVDQLNLVSDIWAQTFNLLFPTMGPKLSWDAGIAYRHSHGYGTASSNLCLFLVNVHKKYSLPLHPTSSQNFVDIGSGVCNLVLQMSVLMHDFQLCFGIEIIPLRAQFAQSACRLFASNAVAACMPFCHKIQAELGDACSNRHSKEALKSAGLVWINNELFSDKDNMKIFELLNANVPRGCVIVTFQQLLKTKRTDHAALQSATPCDFKVHDSEMLSDATSWDKKPKKIFIIQRITMHYHKQQHFQ